MVILLIRTSYHELYYLRKITSLTWNSCFRSSQPSSGSTSQSEPKCGIQCCRTLRSCLDSNPATRRCTGVILTKVGRLVTIVQSKQENDCLTSTVTDENRGFYRMRLMEPDFRNLTKVTLNENCGRTFPNHSAELPARRALIRQASSVCYIADHCPFLRVFGLQPYLKGSATWGSMKRRLRNVAPKSIEALILSLVYLSKKCEYLEQIKVQEITEEHYSQECHRHKHPGSWVHAYRCSCNTQGWDLELGDIVWYMREEVTEDWARYMLDFLRRYDPPSYFAS
jgi:hypothetical protein